jgi:predicted  nucleic acid-binding Zn-ribbon protein
LPPYVEHAQGIDALGKATAQAVILQYEAAAKSVESLAPEINEWTAALESALNDLHEASKYIQAAAQYFRDLGKNNFELIQRSHLAITSAREIADKMKEQIDPADTPT